MSYPNGLLELSQDNAAAYLAARGLPRPDTVRELGGGVSNTVLLVESAATRFVVKQSLGKLRVEQDWFSDRERIFREAAAMRALVRHMPVGSVPEVLFEDRENCLFAMTAAPADAPTWKAQLLAGEICPATAARIGSMLAAMGRASWGSAEYAAEFGDQTVFDQLRLDPYYRATARVHTDLAPRFDELMRAPSARRCALVHGDWSPKNFLVAGGRVMAIDFEVTHYGDPAFDAAFLLNHLALKSFHLPRHREALAGAAASFWQALRDGMAEPPSWFEAATVAHLGALMLARIDGKSPVEYLRAEAVRARVRDFARHLMTVPPAGVLEVFAAI